MEKIEVNSIEDLKNFIQKESLESDVLENKDYYTVEISNRSRTLDNENDCNPYTPAVLYDQAKNSAMMWAPVHDVVAFAEGQVTEGEIMETFKFIEQE